MNVSLDPLKSWLFLSAALFIAGLSFCKALSGAAPPPASPQATYSPAIDLHDRVSVLTWVLGGIQNQNSSFFTDLISDDRLSYWKSETTPRLLAARLQLLKALGPDKHRSYTPHLTLAMRLRGPAAQQALQELHVSEWLATRCSIPIQELCLMQRGPQDPAWRCIHTLGLFRP